MGENLKLNKKITRYNHDFKNIENLIFHVIPSLQIFMQLPYKITI